MKRAWSPSPFHLTIYSETISTLPSSDRFYGNFRTGLSWLHGSALTTCICTESGELSVELPTWLQWKVSVNQIHTRYLRLNHSQGCVLIVCPPPPLSFFSLHVQRFCKVIITKCSVRAILKYTTSIPPPSRLTLHTKGSSKRTRLKQTSSLKPLWRTGNISLESSIH